MKKSLLVIALALLTIDHNTEACTNFIVTKGASTDGSVMVSYAADSHQLYGALYKYNAPKSLKKGAMIDIYEWDTGRYLNTIPQIAGTASTVGNMNEHQVIIGETTYGGREELVDSTGLIDYGSLIYITLQRASSARQAIETIVSLANQYGYMSEGESLSIADKNEAWIFEMIGKGCKIVDGKNVNKGIVWVARRIPNGYICAHANQARITQFPLNDPENCLYAPDVINFAREMGYYSGSDEEFRFADAYCPLTFGGMRGCDSRVWAFFNTFNAEMGQYTDYALGHNPENRIPLWIKPDKKISPKQVFDAMRDHYEGTPMDMTTDIGAAGVGTPYRWRPMTFEYGGNTYTNERATATQQTGFWFVAQARNYLPDHVGGVLWFGVDDAGTSCLTPIYCGVSEVPFCLSEENGSMIEYSDKSSFWIFNRVAQFAYLRYDRIGANVRKIADSWEINAIEQVAEVDKLFSAMPESKQTKALTKFSCDKAEALFNKWCELDKYLMVKFIDGNIKVDDENGFIDNGYDKRIPTSPQQPGYNDNWKKAVSQDNGEILKIVE